MALVLVVLIGALNFLALSKNIGRLIIEDILNLTMCTG